MKTTWFEPESGGFQCLLRPGVKFSTTHPTAGEFRGKLSPQAFGKLAGRCCGKVRNTLRSLQRHMKRDH